MKTKLNLLTAFALFAGILLMPSCKKSDDNPSPKKVTSNITDGKWKITHFSDDGKDETYHFTGYEFTFKDDGTVSAVGSNAVKNGTWSSGNDDSQSKLYLDFGPSDPFDELNDDWHILELTSSKLRLEDVSGGNGGTDLLTFEKL